MSKVQTQMLGRFTNRLFGIVFLAIMYFSVMTPSAGICQGNTPGLRADFSASVRQVCEGQFVSFTASTVGNPTSVLWDVDNDGNLDYSGTTARHTYTKAGKYSVRLIILGRGGADVELKEDFITVTAQPNVRLLADVTEVCAGTMIRVSASGAPLYQWRYSDGTTWTNVGSIAFQPRNSGVLTVTGMTPEGCMDVKTLNLTVNSNPTARTFLTHPTSGNNGQISAFAAGGLSPYLYRINTGGYTFNNVFTNLPAGNHNLYVKDARGCESIIPFTLNAPVSCGKPQNVTLARVRSTDVVITWKEVPGAVNYTISGTSGTGESLTFNWNQSGVRVTGLAPNTTYRARIVANCANGSSEPSDEMVFTTTGISDECAQPNTIRLQSVTENNATVNFSFSGRPNEVLIWYRETGAASWMKFTLPSTATSYQLTSLKTQTEYEIKVGTYCRGTDALWSESLFFTTARSICIAPSAGTVTPSTTSANVSWGSAAGAGAYALRWKLNGTSRWSTRVLAPNVNAFNITGLRPGTRYDLRLTTLCPTRESDGWEAQFLTANLREGLSESENLQPVIYPNPTSGPVEIRLTDGFNSETDINIFDMTGKRVFHSVNSFHDGLISLNLEELNSGIYHLQIRSENATFTQKLIVE